MASRSEMNKKPQAENLQPKVRKCLMCSDTFQSNHICSFTKIFALSMVVFSSRKRISSSESFVLLCASPMATARVSSLEIFLNYLPWPESAGFSKVFLNHQTKWKVLCFPRDKPSGGLNLLLKSFGSTLIVSFSFHYEDWGRSKKYYIGKYASIFI